MNEKDFDDGVLYIYVCASGPHCSRHRELDPSGDPEQNPHGGKAVWEEVKRERTVRFLNRKVKVVRTGCQGFCDYGPTATVWPRGAVHGHLEAEQAAAFMDAVVAKGQDDSHLVYDLKLTKAENAARTGPRR